MPKKLTHEEYVADLASKRSDVIAVARYIDALTPIEHLHIPSGITWLCSPSNAKRGRTPIEWSRRESAKKRMLPKEVYLHRLSLIRDDVELIGEWQGMGKPAQHLYKPEQFKDWHPRPSDVLKGYVPKRFMGNKIRTSSLMSTDEYESLLKLANPEVKLIGDYQGWSVKTMHRHSSGIEWLITPGHALRGQGPRELRNAKISKAKKVPESEFRNRLAKIHTGISLVDGYDSMSKPASFCDIESGEIWTATPTDVLNAGGSRPTRYKRAAASNRLSEQEYLEKLAKVNPKLKARSSYMGPHVPVWFYNEELDEEFEYEPAMALRGHWPRRHMGHRLAKSRTWTDEYYKEVLARQRPDVESLEPYRKSATPILHRHIPSGREWEVSPNGVLGGRCPSESKCGYSEGICRFFFEYMFGNKFPTKHPTKKIPIELHGLELDGYCAELSLAFEHHGLQHYEYIPGYFHSSIDDFISQQERDARRRRGCQEAGITLVEIPDLMTKLSGSRTSSLPNVVNALLKKHILETLENLGWDVEEAWALDGPTYFDYCRATNPTNQNYFWK